MPFLLLILEPREQRPSREGVRVTVRDGTRTLVDGPFAETKEMVGGFFYLTCQTKAEAVAIAATCPAAEWATIEVREAGPCCENAAGVAEE